MAVALVSLGPVVGDGVGKDGARLVELRRSDAAANIWVALKPMLGVLVPEVKGAVGARCRERAVDRVEGDVVDRVDIGDAALGRVSVALEGEVGAFCPVSRCSWLDR